MAATCTIDGCNQPHSCRGYCKKHYDHWRRQGDPLISVRPGTGWLNDAGYRQVPAHGHPTAGPKGWAFEHRMVLYDTIGPGRHPCHWCQRPVDWAAPWPAEDYLTVDHINTIKTDNDPANLVPSCNTCNAIRPHIRRRRVTPTEPA